MGQHHFTQLHVQLHHLPYHYLMIVVVVIIIIIANTIFFIIIIIAIMVTVSRAEACGSKTLPGEDYHSESLGQPRNPKPKDGYLGSQTPQWFAVEMRLLGFQGICAS